MEISIAYSLTNNDFINDGQASENPSMMHILMTVLIIQPAMETRTKQGRDVANWFSKVWKQRFF